MKRCLASLPPGTKFNVILFAEDARPFASAPVAVDATTLAAVEAFVDAAKPDGGTNLSSALDRALLLTEPDSRRALRDLGIDTVVLLTDGVPSRGPVLDPEQILAEVTRQNRRLRVAIHAVSAGGDDAFLRDLAQANFGEFRRIR